MDSQISAEQESVQVHSDFAELVEGHETEPVVVELDVFGVFVEVLYLEETKALSKKKKKKDDSWKILQDSQLQEEPRF